MRSDSTSEGELASANDASTISKIERNRMTPTYECFRKLARGLDVDVAEPGEEANAEAED